MNSAKISSPRLQRVLKVLRDKKPHTTRDIVRQAHVCAVNSCIAELRCHGLDIECKRKGNKFYYRLSDMYDLAA